MKGETAELSKLMQTKREEKTTPEKEVFTKKERGKSRKLSRREKAKVSARAQNVVAANNASTGSTDARRSPA